MRSLLRSVALTLAISTLMAEEVSELALTQHPFRAYSAFWPNLHHALLSESVARRAASAEKRPATESEAANLTAEEQRTWESAVTFYSRELADLHPLFEMGPIWRALLAAKVEPPTAGLEPAHRQVLAAATSVYRKHRWSTDDRANRDWISECMSKVASLSPAVPDRLARLYGVAWFTSPVRVDVVPIASREGAFTSIDPAPAHITISSRNSVITGWTAAKVLFHESSHALVQPTIDAFAAELKAQGKKARDLWHVALFFLTGEVVRQALSERGVTYEPYLYRTGLFDRAWPQYKSVIETHRRTFVQGAISREEAIRRIVTEIKNERAAATAPQILRSPVAVMWPVPVDHARTWRERRLNAVSQAVSASRRNREK